jgi:hypothetical protein
MKRRGNGCAFSFQYICPMHIDIPGTYEKVTVGQLADYLAAKTDVERIVAITGITQDQAKKLPVKTIARVMVEFGEVRKNETNNFQQIVEVNKKKFGFIPCLEEINLAEYLDFITYAKPENFKQNVVKLMLLMYRPITLQVGKQYQVEEYDPIKATVHTDDVRAMSASVLSGALAFFLTLQNELHLSSLEYLAKQTKNLTKEIQRGQKDLLRSGASITSSLKSQTIVS